MCGIVGYVGTKDAVSVLLSGLEKLEYRGYDSAGIAVLNGSGMEIRRARGKLINLKEAVKDSPVSGKIGIGHTRWATHGKPTEQNAHPHRAGGFAVVHNGIIENYSEIKEFLQNEGHEFCSETDTEVVSHLIWYYSKKGMDVLKSIKEAISQVRGSYALAIMNENQPNVIYFAKHGSPMIIGLGNGENFVASDIPALLSYTKEMLTIEDGEMGMISNKAVQIYEDLNKPVKRKSHFITWSADMADKGGFKHFMLKEIFEQPCVIERIISERIDQENEKIVMPEMDGFYENGKPMFDEIIIAACGTSYHAGLIGKYWIEQIAGIPVQIDYSSEFRYRSPLIDEKKLVIPISQSGETADTLAAVKLVKEKGAKVLGLCNVFGSSILRASDAHLFLHAGPEIGVASTKVFTSQLFFLFLLAVEIGCRNGRISSQEISGFIKDFLALPRALNQILDGADAVKKLAIKYSRSSQVLFIGRGISFPVALEGALKLKEISYVHAEGFPAGELKHGPIALVDNSVCVVAISPDDQHSEKMSSNIEEVVARGASVFSLYTSGDDRLKGIAASRLPIPVINPLLTPILTVVPLQLFAYYIADYKGTDVDQPRNLAKSVTVE